MTTIYAIDSGIAITAVRVSNFRSLANIEVELNDLTVLIGANNAGKTSFLEALFASIGSGRKLLGQDDVRLEHGEAFAPKERNVTIDLRIRPVGPTVRCWKSTRRAASGPRCGARRA